MNNYNIEYIVKIVLNILIVGLVIYAVARLFIFLLPVIVVFIIIYYAHKIYIETKNKMKENTKKSKNDKIIDAEIINERFDK